MTKENAAADGRTSTAATEKKLCYHSFIFRAPILARMTLNRKCVFKGAISHQKSVYRFSLMWQKYGTPEFEVVPNDMTAGMTRRRYPITRPEEGV